jgi:hypothetical protein
MLNGSLGQSDGFQLLVFVMPDFVDHSGPGSPQ